MMMPVYQSVAAYYADRSLVHKELLAEVIVALDAFGRSKLQRNRPVYTKPNLTTNPHIKTKKSSSRWYVGIECGMQKTLYIGLYDVNHFLDLYPHTRYVFDSLGKAIGKIKIRTQDDVAKAVALIQLSMTL